MALLAALIAAPAAAQSREEVERALGRPLPAAGWEDTALDVVLRDLSDQSGVNFYLDPEVAIPEITFRHGGLELRSVLALVLRPYKLIHLWRDEVLWITGEENLPVHLQMYDIRDLTFNPSDFPGPEITLDMSWSTDAPPAPSAEEWSEDLIVELVQAHTGGESWDENPRVSISAEQGVLIVRQTAAVQRQIERFLSELRRYR